MTLNTSSSVSPHLHLPITSPETSSRRRTAVGSPTSAVFKPGATIASPQASLINSSHRFLLPVQPTQSSNTILNGSAPRGNLHYRSKSPTQNAVSPNRRRQRSKSPEKGNDQTQCLNGSLLGNGRKNNRQNHLTSKSGLPNMQAKRSDAVQQTSVTAARPIVKSHRSNQSNHSSQSTSLPSTPNHMPRISSSSRSPSPPTCLLDSPRSAASEPVSATPYQKPLSSGCRFETALVNARRRMPYSIGFEKLKQEKPKLERLAVEDEEKLTKEMMEQFESLKPSAKSNSRRRMFLEKLSRILNEEWPGYDTMVYAFGSTENHLCMEDSDVDVCITTQCKEIELTCRLAAVLAKRGMEKVVCVPGAKVPIVKIWDPQFQIACDMNVNNTLALDNTRMIKTYVEIDDRVRPLALVLKHWTKERILNDAATGGTLSSYTWICMILNFLQTRNPPILPSLHARPHPKKPLNNGVDVSFDDDIRNLRGFGKDNKESLGGLLFAFFKTYGHELDYEKKVISVRKGKLLSKEEKNWQFLQNNRLCVEEPFSVSRNLGNTADDSSMRGIHLEFRRAHKILAEKADLVKVCEHYEFPPEEAHSIPAPPPSRPVTLSRSNSNHGRNRGGFNGSNRGNRYQHHTRANTNRRASNSTAFNQGMTQPHQYPPELFGYHLPAVTTQDQLLTMAQMHVQAQAQAQAQLIAQAQFQQQHQQQHQHKSHKQHQQQSSSNNTAVNQEAINALQLASWPYLAQFYGMNMFYHPGFPLNNGETANAPTSPPITPANPDTRHDQRHDGTRLGLGRGRRNGHNQTNSRSQSQPPPLYSTNYTRGGTHLNGVTGSDDEFGDHSSNGNPPETPPEEEPEQYVGYYSIGGSLQPDVAVIDSQVGDVDVSFMEQKTMVDRQKRYSSEKLPQPLVSRDSSPVSLNRHSNNCHDIPTPMFPNGVPNGVSTATHIPPMTNGAATGFATPVDAVFPFEYDGVSDSVPQGISVSNGASERRRFAQRLLESHNQEVRPEVTPYESSTGSVNGEINSSYTATPSPVASVPISPVVTGDSQSDEDISTSPNQSPDARQKKAGRTTVWSNSRTHPAGSLKNKSYSSSQEDLPLPPLTPVPEVSTLSQSQNAKKESKHPTLPPKPVSNGIVAKDDPTPPTPAPSTKNGQRSGGSRGKSQGGKPSGNSNNKEASETKPEHKTNSWRKTQPKKNNKKRASPNSKQEAVKDSERKGG